MRRDQRHLVLSLALAGTVLATAATPVLASVALSAVQANSSAFIKIDSAFDKTSPKLHANAGAFWKWNWT